MFCTSHQILAEEDTSGDALSEAERQTSHPQPDKSDDTRILFAADKQEAWEAHEHALGRSPVSRRDTFDFKDFAVMDDQGLEVDIQDPPRSLAVGIQSSSPLVPVPRLDEGRTAVLTFFFDPEHTDHAIFALVADTRFPSAGALRGSAVADHDVQVRLEKGGDASGYRCELSIRDQDALVHDGCGGSSEEEGQIALALHPDGGLELRDVRGNPLLVSRIPDAQTHPAPSGWHPHAVAEAPEEGAGAGLALTQVSLAFERFDTGVLPCILHDADVQELLQDREPGVQWDKWTDGDEALTQHVQRQENTLTIKVPEGEDSARVGIATPGSVLWPCFGRSDASATLVLDLDDQKTTGLGVILSTQDGLGEDPDRSSRFKLTWQGPEGEKPGIRAQRLVGTGVESVLEQPSLEVPGEVRLKLTVGGVLIEADGLPAKQLDWPELKPGQPLRAWIHALPSSGSQPSLLGLQQIRLEHDPGTEEFRTDPAPGVDPLPMTTRFSRDMGEEWEPSTRQGRSGHFDSDTSFGSKGMQVSIDASAPGKVSGIRSTHRLVDIDDRVEETPYRLRFNVDPEDFTGMEIWLARSAGRTENNLDSDQVQLVRHQEGRLADHLEIRISSAGRSVWSRVMDPEQVAQAWDGTVNIDLGEEWIRAGLPGVASLRAPFGVTSSEPYVAVRSSTATRQGIPARLQLHSIQSGWLTPPGMDGVQRERLTDIEEFCPERFLENLADSPRHQEGAD
ncbi:hypothetical protein LRB11_13405 [Ectothiorhodospira haloalkaliphila]|uniref:hypothetical protein n=1 Tax=Ectothiorhodospira haloalkaliphila TaxID=421628 RepID=UPI001EE9AB4F|nr:hypothetical protein [Ectothiorhodospira haloalkaliphila]MCG5525917.1 hypothetical protein [Ectothiorhodospira haloalkaliphila]